MYNTVIRHLCNLQMCPLKSSAHPAPCAAVTVLRTVSPVPHCMSSALVLSLAIFTSCPSVPTPPTLCPSGNHPFVLCVCEFTGMVCCYPAWTRLYWFSISLSSWLGGLTWINVLHKGLPLCIKHKIRLQLIQLFVLGASKAPAVFSTGKRRVHWWCAC